MWQLQTIEAQNICAFRKLDYVLNQNKTTLVFGNNMDNDSQQSNGSGKSALIEAIAIGLLGESLRKVKIDEIINDNENEATVIISLYNTVSRRTIKVERVLSRKKPQAIVIYDNGEVVVMPSVAEYNQYILELIGLSKDDIFANFILSKHKFKSFLTSSDNDKKEIINRFSNGVVVDDAIAIITEDLVPVEKQLEETNKSLSACSGQITAYTEQINLTKEQISQKTQNKAEQIATWKQAISDKRAEIRKTNASVQSLMETVQKLNIEANDSLQAIEDHAEGVEVIYSSIQSTLKKYQLPSLTKDYTVEVKSLREYLNSLNNCIKLRKKDIDCHQVTVDGLTKKLAELQQEYQSHLDSNSAVIEAIKATMNDITQKIQQLNLDTVELKKQQSSINTNIAELNKQLAGVIQCPKCQYEFTLAQDIDVEEKRKELKQQQKVLSNTEKQLKDNEELVLSQQNKKTECFNEINRLESSGIEYKQKISEVQSELNKANRVFEDLKKQLQSVEEDIESTQKKISKLQTNMFNEAFDILDNEISKHESEIKRLNVAIEVANGSIAMYQESIQNAENMKDDGDMLEVLENKLAERQREYDTLLEQQEKHQANFNALKQQESVFVEFKTYLANTKIKSLASKINEFLEQIGSDIRINFSGYTVLKSGKIRDKISITLIRNGVDCGSFDKFSEGEKARVNLANILAMHNLTNNSCEDGKGLNLLILDEILDATDESGLANIFESLNMLKITSLVVSHGNIAENYPHKLIVNKLNGVSFIA